MKIEINCPTVQVQASCRPLAAGQGYQLNVYFFSGQRYEHEAIASSYGSGSLFVRIENSQGEDVGTVNFTAETQEEDCFSPPFEFWEHRNKETRTFMFINKEFTATDTSQAKFQYERNFT